MAIDFGLKRCGLAITDETNTFAFGLETVDAKQLMQRLNELVVKETVSIIVLGLPKRLNDEDTHITQNVYLLKEALEKSFPALQIDLIDERFSSKMAMSAMHSAGATRKQKKQKELVDKVSATLLLQAYLEQL